MSFFARKSFLTVPEGFIIFLITIVTAVDWNECNRFKNCRGPIRHYEDLGCKPVYENPGDCCAVRYDCSHLNNRSSDKCYANGHEYAIGEVLREEDYLSPCAIGCVCEKGFKEEVGFFCKQLDCPHGFNDLVEEECYVEYHPDECCGLKVCNKSEGDKFYCENEGKLYKSGDVFYPEENPSLVCYCMKGYRGENVAPFCKKLSCETELEHSAKLVSNCAPVFYDPQTPQTSCGYSYRCQNKYDTVLSLKDSIVGYYPIREMSEEMMCKFGNLTMNIGDELNQATNHDSVCVKCVCEVPPTLTCHRVPYIQCENAKSFRN